MEIIPILALNSLFGALLLSVLVFLFARFNLPLRLLLAIVVLIVADATISIATLFAFAQLELLPSKYTTGWIRQYLTVEYVARSIVFWVVGILLILKLSAEKSRQFALGIALIFFAWSLSSSLQRFRFLRSLSGILFGDLLAWLFIAHSPY